MKPLLTDMIKEGLIVLMLFNFSMSSFGLQKVVSDNTSNISVYFSELVTPENNNNDEPEHCNKSSSSQHCSNCAIISTQQPVITISSLTKANDQTILYSIKEIELPFKPPRI